MFSAGARALGFDVEAGLPAERPGREDVLVTWNRIGPADAAAQTFERVLVVENALWGNDFAGQRWLHMGRKYHNLVSGGPLGVGGDERWDALGVELEPFRTHDGETVFLPQRGIGPARVAMPHGWAHSAQGRYGVGRVRPHPGLHPGRFAPLRADLALAGRVVTWGSGAAVLALMWGVPVVSELPGWVAAQDNSVEGRLGMFRRLAWAHVTHEEIASGVALERFLQ